MEIFRIETSPIGTNTYLAADEETGKAFIVDPGSYSPGLRDVLEDKKLELEYIILTHGHGDHIMGVPGMIEDFPEIKVVAHEDEKEMLADSHYNVSFDFGSPVELRADIWVKDGESLKVGNTELKFIHTPGHSPGGMCIYVESDNVLFCGDTLFQRSIGRTDFPGGSFEVLKKSIHEKLWVLPDETSVYPGHMGATSIGYEKENNPFV
ncbi:MAG: MBL fold metallo-hydrolase [Firmicutes bacterium]|nr:MBL fold metallo-hydrolase [Bacillota bacterium]